MFKGFPHQPHLALGVLLVFGFAIFIISLSMIETTGERERYEIVPQMSRKLTFVVNVASG